MSTIKTLTVVQAYDGATIEGVPLNDQAAVEAMLTRASDIHRNNKQGLPAYQRIEILRRLIVLMQSHAEDRRAHV